ncbi:MAG: polyprenyl synthetase family protein [Gammaproteobacteria bacterium]
MHSRVPLVAEIAAYLVQAGGKRLRPLLVLLAARSSGDSSPHPVKLAVAIEFLHTAMLLHDDVVDESTLRRGRRTANAEWGNAASVLVGDFLHSRAFELMVELGNIDVMALISKATNGIAEGEVQQLTLLQNTSTSEADYLEVIYRKTALLFEVSAESGAVLGGASASEAAAYREYGRHLGLAFQLMDDWLDYEGSAQDLGKNTGDDLAEGKVTLPIILALQAAGASDRRILEQAITQPGSIAFEDVRCIAERCGGIETTKHRAAAEASLAESALQDLPDSACKSQMIRLSQFAVERSN